MHDAVALEKLAIPSVAVCTDQFEVGAKAIARMRGAPDYRFAVVTHPLGPLDTEGLRARAEEAYPQVRAIALGHLVDPAS
ncbi:MAG: hypothetical protein S0880_16360 [Actinomycetota bacterium]|nr:hypothetical protein [Actinomycetota bacterium]